MPSSFYLKESVKAFKLVWWFITEVANTQLTICMLLFTQFYAANSIESVFTVLLV